ncbi:MAG: tRNA lysidine(34) synthetase TilS [Nannocystaceae bacterium]
MARPHDPRLARALGPFRDVLARAISACATSRPHVLLACSGGPDSLAMVGLADLTRRSLNFVATVAHVDHGLRERSGQEADVVEKISQSWEMPFVTSRLELCPGPGLPARARDARRAALREHARRCGADVVALGHTATDQAETMLMNLSRGAGLEGVAAMAPVDLPWVRPMMALSRVEARALAAGFDRPFVDDPTNRDRAHFRVRVREQVLPLLRSENPRLERALCSAASQARDAEDALQGWAARELEVRRGAGGVWQLTGLNDLPRAVRVRIIRRICRMGGADLQQLGSRVVEAVDAAVLAQLRARRESGPGIRPKSWDLHPEVRVRVDKSGIVVNRASASNH